MVLKNMVHGTWYKGTDEIIGFDLNDNENSDGEKDSDKIKGANHVLVLME